MGHTQYQSCNVNYAISRSDMSNLKVFSYGDILNFMSRVTEFQL